MAEEPIMGGCNCGAVRYAVTDEPVCVFICHCHLCQKRTGSPFSMTMILPGDAVELISGEPEMTERELPDGRRNVTAVCGACHSRLWTRRDGWPNLNLRAGTLDNTNDIRPVAQIWTSSAQPWAVIADNILSYEEQPTDIAPLLAAWKARRG